MHGHAVSIRKRKDFSRFQRTAVFHTVTDREHDAAWGLRVIRHADDTASNAVPQRSAGVVQQAAAKFPGREPLAGTQRWRAANDLRDRLEQYLRARRKTVHNPRQRVERSHTRAI